MDSHVIPDLYEKLELGLVKDKLINEDGTPFYAHSMAVPLQSGLMLMFMQVLMLMECELRVGF